jgi:DNA adenine methylase
MSQLTRPMIRYHGGKWKLAPWIISHFPAHRVFVEPFGGGGSVLLRKPRSYAEIYNDLDSEVVNLFRVVRERGRELRHALELTPFARDEFVEAWMPSENSLEQARRTVVRAYMGFGSAAVTLMRANPKPGRRGLARTGFRANSNRSGTTPAHDWANYPNALDAIIERLRGVVIENRNALDLMPQHDGDQTLFYVDPPYVAETRDKGGDYRHELTNADHESLADVLHALRGAVVLSGYDCPLYSALYTDWHRVERVAFADGARLRIECLWLNEAARQSVSQQRLIA